MLKWRELAFTLVIPLRIQDQLYTSNYSLIPPFHTAFLPFCFTAPACWNPGRASSLWKTQQFGNSSSNIGLVADLLGEIQLTLECPCGENTIAELCGWVWEEKCNDLHLNGSTLPNTMGLSFIGVRPPLHSEKEACRDLALMSSRLFSGSLQTAVCEAFLLTTSCTQYQLLFHRVKGFHN